MTYQFVNSPFSGDELLFVSILENFPASAEHRVEEAIGRGPEKRASLDREDVASRIQMQQVVLADSMLHHFPLLGLELLPIPLQPRLAAGELLVQGLCWVSLNYLTIKL